MKTNTYLRWSLLIPFVVWGVSLLIFMIAGRFSTADPLDRASPTSGYILLLFLVFYVFGIIVWIFPYMLLALILFFWSFIGKPRMALVVFALSPIAMTLLTAATLNIMLGTSEPGTIFPSYGIIDQDYLSLNLLSAGFALIWGYICVGIGYGVYRSLQRRQLIRDEVNTELPVAINQTL